VSTVEEVRKFKSFAAEVTRELTAEGVPFRHDIRIGAMLEVPSAAIITDLLAREVDFFSVGTNDLIQYSLAVDRNNEHVTDLYQPFHPALLRMLRFAFRSAAEADRAIGVCGEMAGDPRFVPLLLGLGVRRLSMSPRAVPRIKRLIRALQVGELRAAVEECANLGTAAEVEARMAKLAT
jgi:phosphotransferase system enzyme I (PtsI)